MKTDILTPEQFAQYEAIVNEFDHYRTLSEEEKEDIIIRIASSTFLDLMCDWAFKHVFGHNEQNLMLLLNDILPEKIVHIEYDPNEIDIWKGDDKKVIMDVLCHTQDGRKFIVEMQKADKEHFRNRMLYYEARMIGGQLQAGDSYGKLMPVYVVCFMNFRLKHDTDKLVYHYQVREGTGELYGNILNIFLCELPRLSTQPGKSLTPIEVWFDILQNMSIFVEKPELYGSKYDPIFESCRQSPIPEKEKLQYFRSMFDDDVRSMLTDEDRQEIFAEGQERGKAEGKAEGLAEGHAIGKAEVAKAMLEDGQPAETVSKYTGLPIEKLAAL